LLTVRDIRLSATDSNDRVVQRVAVISIYVVAFNVNIFSRAFSVFYK